MASNLQVAKAIIAGGAVAGAMFPAVSLYNSGQEDRGLLNTAAHLAVSGAVGAGVGYAGTISGYSYLAGDLLDSKTIKEMGQIGKSAYKSAVNDAASEISKALSKNIARAL